MIEKTRNSVATEIYYKEKKLLYIDLSNYTKNNNIDEIIELINKTIMVVKTYPLKSILSLTDVSNSHYNKEIFKNLVNMLKENSPYIKASAVIGVTGMKRASFQPLLRLTNRNIYLALSEEEAKEWLVKQ